MNFHFKDDKTVTVKWHPQFKSGWKDALSGRKPTRVYRYEKQQREYNRGYSLGTKARNHAFAQRIAEAFV